MRIHAINDTARQGAALFTRRSFLRAIGLASARSFRSVAVGFTAIGDDLVWLLRWCAYGGAPRFAGAG